MSDGKTQNSLRQALILAMADHHSGNNAEAQQIVDAQLEAIAAWNRRAPDPKVAALVEAARELSNGLELDPDDPERALRISSGFVRANALLADLRAALQAIEGGGK